MNKGNLHHWLRGLKLKPRAAGRHSDCSICTRAPLPPPNVGNLHVYPIVLAPPSHTSRLAQVSRCTGARHAAGDAAYRGAMHSAIRIIWDVTDSHEHRASAAAPHASYPSPRTPLQVH